jgi:dihydrofolate reductase
VADRARSSIPALAHSTYQRQAVNGPHHGTAKDIDMTTTTLTADLFISVDGWARGEHSPAYFGYDGPDLRRWIEEELARPQHVLMGRRTYEALAAVADQVSEENPLTGPPTTVFSRTLSEVTWPNATVAGDLLESVRSLKATSPVPLRTMGSLSLVRQLLTAGVLDRLRLMVFPLLVGPGGREPAFEGVGEADLTLTAERVLDGRILLLEYAPTGEPAPR